MDVKNKVRGGRRKQNENTRVSGEIIYPPSACPIILVDQIT